MTSTEPGDRRRLDRPPSERYADPASPDALAGRGAQPSALIGPLIRADIIAAFGAAALVMVGAVFASTFGLLFVAGAMGAAIGLVLARAAVPEPGAGRAVDRRTVSRLAMGLALVAVVVADVATWLYGRGEGGTLGLFDYLWAAFGPFVPGVAFAAIIGAAWGANAGPVQR